MEFENFVRGCGAVSFGLGCPIKFRQDADRANPGNSSRGHGNQPGGGNALRVEIQLFAVARQRVGRSAIALDLPDGARVADLKQAIAEAHPELAPLMSAVLIAIDAEYAAEDQLVPPGSELAVIPPVSGGSHVSPE